MEDYNRLRLEQLPWIEKYKPKSVKELYLEDDLKDKITIFVEKQEMPNLILTGISGIGKTCTIYALMKDLYGHYCNDAVLEINSFDGGVKILNEDLVNFCKTRISYRDNCR